MRIRSALKLSAMTLALAASAYAASAYAATAKEHILHWAYSGDAQSMDPMSLDESFTLGFQGNIYESLFGYDKDLKLVPQLATSWSNPEPDKWIIHLRKGVKFHDGSTFTADDVVFSWKRSLTPGSDMKNYGAEASDVKKIDDYTVEIDTAKPYPILPRDWTFLYMMSKSWSEKHDTTQAASIKNGAGNYANMHEDGTGPYMLVDREPGVKTVLKRFPGYWNKHMKGNVDEVIFQPITQESTRVAALLSGDMDIVQSVPVQDWNRLKNTKGIKVLNRPEDRAIFIGFDQFRPELLYSNVKGKNPFKDRRVREAFDLAVNTNAINQKIMRGAAHPLGTLIATSINGYDPSFGAPYKPDPAKSKKLLAEAGYPNGFEVTLDCPNDRYINDEKICQAVAGMLAKVGIKIDLLAQTKSKYFAKVDAQGGNMTSMYLLGWSPSSVDADNVLVNLVHCPNKKGLGQFNYGHYCNKKIDALEAQISAETNQTKRDALIKEAFTLLRDDYGYMPLHQPPLSWGAKSSIQLAQRPDDVLDLRNVVMP